MPSAFFNAAFRYDEPYDAAWRDHLQLAAIEKGDISPFFATVDFTKLAAGDDDDMLGQRGGVPTNGFMSLLFASHFETNQGRRIPERPRRAPPGQLQPAERLLAGLAGEEPAARAWRSGGRAVMTARRIWPAGCSATWSTCRRWRRRRRATAFCCGSAGYAINAGDVVYGGRDLYRAVGERADHPTLVVGTDARGADQWAYGQSGASNFETWADVARRFKLDPAKTAIERVLQRRLQRQQAGADVPRRLRQGLHL